ncbi:GIN domain-containing protein [Sphingomonas sp. RIT328]|uniref:GIN domain-containing protein n=1 Tax=Sphingomonas sp. RIT328 TaxID=1470591 RepID=UPI00044F8C15|nr:DUF2807 domain-containing protein [Sphingomonas sp. RIT328]EZP50984.1 hypothetical protein BW41_02938 [Sphingomonas sp. RIT328]
MIRLLAALALLPTAAAAEQRDVALGSFERVRINGSFAVTIATGAPAATVEGDRAAIGAVDLHADGTTLTIRQTNATRWGEQRQAATAPLRIRLTTPRLAALTVIGGSVVTIAQLKGARVDLSAAGTATLAVAAVEADQLGVQLAGDGKITLAGRATDARLVASGTGTIEAAALATNDLTVHLDGPGTVRAQARYTALVASNGLGTVSVAGRPKCRVVASAGAPVTCGTGE